MKPNQTESKHSRRPWTYRVLNIPLDWDNARLNDFLEKRCKVPKTGVGSLAVEHHGASQIATVDLLDGVVLPRNLEDPYTAGVDLQTDTDFLGITTLFSPEPKHHQIE